MVIVVLFAVIERKRLPPGPRAWPLIGNLNSLSSNPQQPHKLLTNLARTYGPIITFKFGKETGIILSDFSLIKEAFITKADILSDRPELIIRWSLSFGGEGESILFIAIFHFALFFESYIYIGRMNQYIFF